MSGSKYNLSWLCSRVFTVADHCDAVYENLPDTGRKLMRFFIGRAIGYSRRVEYHNVCEHSLFEQATVLNR